MYKVYLNLLMLTILAGCLPAPPEPAALDFEESSEDNVDFTKLTNPCDNDILQTSVAYNTNCASCHGASGNGNGSFPAINQEISLSEFKNAVRTGPSFMPSYSQGAYPDAVLESDYYFFQKMNGCKGVVVIDDDTSNNNNNDDVMVTPPKDEVAPVLTLLSPSNNSTLAVGTTSLNVQLYTNEKAICSFDNNVFNTFNTTGDQVHSHSFSNLVNGQAYSHKLICYDGAGNGSNEITLTFSVMEEAVMLGVKEAFNRVIQNHCLSCHGNFADEAELNNLIVNGKPLESRLYLSLLGANGVKKMPPAKNLMQSEIEDVRKYIESLMVVNPVNDTTAPNILSFSPNGNQFQMGVPAITLQVQTNEESTCRFSMAANTDFVNMMNFQSTGMLAHAHNIVGPNIGNYAFYVKCADKANNISAESQLSFSVMEVAQTKDQLRASVRQILNNNCISCHGDGGQYQSVVDLAVDVKVLELNPKYIKVKDPENSYLYQKVSSGSMAIYLPSTTDLQTLNAWIKAVDGTDTVNLNCKEGEAPLDNVCIKIGSPVSSRGYRMITPYEFFRDINSIFRVNLENKDPITGLPIIPQPLTMHGFENQFGLVTPNSVFTSAISQVADQLASELNAKTDFDSRIVNCMNDTVVNCGMNIARNNYIPKLFRRQLSDTELQVYRDYFQNAQGTKKEIYINFFKALIQSPSFLFREEHGTSPNPDFSLDPYEVASRLSYFVRGRAPDDELLQKAANGTILQKEVRIAEATRIMDNNIFVSNSHLAKVFLESIGIKRNTLAHEDALSDDMYRESIWITRDVFFNNEQKWTNIFTNNYTYVNKRLSDIYGFNASNSNSDWVRVEYSDNKRRGILTHASYLSAFYDGRDLEKTNDIRRGINFYEKVLCRNMPLPPADVDVDLDPAADLNGCRTDNRKNSTLSQAGTCFQCHQHFDRIGMGFERYNNKGEYREFEKERPECSTIENFYLDGGTQFNDLPEFTNAVSENKDVGRCLALKMKAYAYGTDIPNSELESIYLEMPTFQKTMLFKDLVRDIVGSDEFIKRKPVNEN
jgi:mono/diheme cytochrome c family protein